MSLRVLLAVFLAQLNLSENQLCGVNIFGHGTHTSEGIEAIAHVLRVRGSLNALCLDQNDINDTGATAIADALKVNAALLNRLSLALNQIGDAGATAIANALNANASLTQALASSSPAKWPLLSRTWRRAFTRMASPSTYM